MTRFAKFALSGLTALSLTAAPLPATAAPDGEDVVKALAGLAVLGIIANQINERDNKRKSTAAKSRVYDPYRSIDRQPRNRVIDGTIRRPNEHKDVVRGARRTRLPDQCLRIVETAKRDRLVYGKRCLNRNFVHANQLPERCKLIVRNGNRTRSVYGARCLSRDGWRVAGR